MSSPTVVNTGLLYFYPEANATLAVTSVSAAVLVGLAGDVFVVQNDGTSTAYCAQGDSTVTAVAGGAATLAGGTASFPILPGAIINLRALPNNGYVAAITDSATTTLRISRGSGQ